MNELSEETISFFLKGIYDAEGNVSFSGKRIRFYNSNIKLINLVTILLDSIGIKNTSIYKRKSEIHIIRRHKILVKPVYCLKFGRKKNLEIFFDKIGFFIRRKQETLEKILNSYQRNHIQWTKQEIKFLKNNYHRNYREIARILNRKPTSVERALYRFNLKPNYK